MNILSLSLPDNRYTPLRDYTKKPALLDWTNKPKSKEEVKGNMNVGFILGDGFVAVDCDSLELQEAVEQLIKTETYTQKSARRGLNQYIFKVGGFDKNLTLKFGGRSVGEVLCSGKQIVLAPSKYKITKEDVKKNPELKLKAGDIKEYLILKDIPIAEITKQTLMEVILQFDSQITDEIKQEIKTYEGSDIDNLKITDFISTAGMKQDNRGQYYGSNPWHSSTTGSNFYINPSKNLAYCFRCMTAIQPIKALALNEGIIHNCSDSLRGEEFTRTLEIVKDKGYIKTKENLKPSSVGTEGDILSVQTFKDFMNLKEDKSYIVENFLKPSQLVLLYSPPKRFKSLVSLDMAMAISVGERFLGRRTKKSAVLLLDGENGAQVLRERLRGLFAGRRRKKQNFPLYIRRYGNLINERKQVNEKFLSQLRNTIVKHKIKLIIFDTLHRFAFYDENKADDLNLLYVKVFQPLLDMGTTILFLHHSTKKGDYRGSSDLMGQVDSAFYILRQPNSNKFDLINEVSRTGEIPTISGEVIFGDGIISIEKIGEVEQREEKISKLKLTTQKIKSLFVEGKQIKRKDIELTLANDDFECSRATLNRVLKYLCEELNYLDKNDKGVYWLRE